MGTPLSSHPSQTPPNPPSPTATPKPRLPREGSLSHFSAAFRTLMCSTSVFLAQPTAHEGRGLGRSGSSPQFPHTLVQGLCQGSNKKVFADILALHNTHFIIIILYVHVCESCIEPYHVTGNVLLALRVWTHLVLTRALWGKHYCYSPFTDEEIEAQKG